MENEKVQYLAIYEKGDCIIKTSFDEIRILPGKPHLFKHVIKESDPYSLICYDELQSPTRCVLGRYEFISARGFNSNRPFEFKFYDLQTENILAITEVGTNIFEYGLAYAMRMVKEALRFENWNEYLDFKKFVASKTETMNMKTELQAIKSAVKRLEEDIQAMKSQIPN